MVIRERVESDGDTSIQADTEISVLAETSSASFKAHSDRTAAEDVKRLAELEQELIVLQGGAAEEQFVRIEADGLQAEVDVLPTGFRKILSRFARLDRATQIEFAKGVFRGILMKRKFDEWDFPIVGPGVSILKRNGARLEAGRFARFSAGSQIVIGTDPEKNPTLRIGPKSSIGPGTKINVGDDLRIGGNTHISWDCDMSSDDFHQVVRQDGTLSRRSAPIVIGDNSAVFRRSIINAGVTIGDNSAVGSGAVVVKDIPSNTFAAGNPAKPIKSIRGIRL